ncbi:AI-2E family transporter, partial [Patescibacteria group bacterium]|nr:AI-2E family transporter [Patescibacteria group bacterium]
MDNSRLETFSLLGLVCGVFILLFFVFAPFFQILTLAAVLAISVHAPYKKLARFLRGSNTIAATSIVLLVLIFFIVPILLLGWQVFLQAQSLFISLQDNPQYFHALQNSIVAPLQSVFPSFSINLNQYVGNVVSFVSNNLAGLVTGTFSVVLQTILMLFAFFFFLRDGEKLLGTMRKLSPFKEEHTDEILLRMKRTTDSVVKGTLYVSLIRWALIIIGFYFLGIPNAILWGTIGGIVAALPALGTILVFIPAVAYLYLTGSIAFAVGLALLGIFITIVTDNVLTSYFFGKGLEEMPEIFVLFSILGGILFFGPLGFILGPLVLSL